MPVPPMAHTMLLHRLSTPDTLLAQHLHKTRTASTAQGHLHRKRLLNTPQQVRVHKEHRNTHLLARTQPSSWSPRLSNARNKPQPHKPPLPQTPTMIPASTVSQSAVLKASHLKSYQQTTTTPRSTIANPSTAHHPAHPQQEGKTTPTPRSNNSNNKPNLQATLPHPKPPAPHHTTLTSKSPRLRPHSNNHSMTDLLPQILTLSRPSTGTRLSSRPRSSRGTRHLRRPGLRRLVLPRNSRARGICPTDPVARRPVHRWVGEGTRGFIGSQVLMV